MTGRRKRYLAAALLLLLAIVALAAVACTVGSSGIPLSQTLRIWGDLLLGRESGNGTYRLIVAGVRMPRILLSILVGGALAVSGACMQGVFKNPMADPGILGISSGAGLGGALCIALGWQFGLLGMGAIPLCAFAGGALAVAAVYSLARVRGRVSVLSLLLAGTAVSAFLSAMTSGLMVLHHDKIESIITWTMGSFTSANWEKLLWAAPPILVCCGLTLFFGRDLNALLLGDEEARSLGINAHRTRLCLLALCTLATGCAVAACGVIGFVGLMAPHAMRLLVGPDHRVLLPFSFLGGGFFLLLMDTLARTLAAPLELPVGVLTAAVGGPFFLILLRRSNRKGEGA